jgi:hypothetical protein
VAPVPLARTVAVGLLVSAAVAVPAQSAAANDRRGPVRDVSVSCVEPGGALAFGGARALLEFGSSRLEKGDFFVVVPVSDATGLDAGDRLTVDRRQKEAVVVVPADGRALTPAVTVEVRLGGDVVQRIAVKGGCGTVDPAPERGPLIGEITAVDGLVSAQVTNGSGVADEVGMTLYAVGGNTGESRFLSLAPGQTGTVSFAGVPAGTYYLEGFGYTTFIETESAPFVVG